MLGIKWTKVPRWALYVCAALYVVWAIPWFLAYQVLRVLLVVCLWMLTWRRRLVYRLWEDTQ